MKKREVIFLILILISLTIIFLTSITKAEDITGIPGEINPETGLPEGIPTSTEEVKNKTQSTLDYLGQEWQKILLKNSIISTLDSFFTKISIIFVILFGQPYSLSLTLFIIILLWTYFLFMFAKIIGDLSAFSPATSKIISLSLVIIMAQIQIIKKITEFLMWFIFAKKSTWWNILITILIILVFILLSKYSSTLVEKIKKGQEELEKEQEKADRKVIHSTASGIKEGLKS